MIENWFHQENHWLDFQIWSIFPLPNIKFFFKIEYVKLDIKKEAQKRCYPTNSELILLPIFIY